MGPQGILARIWGSQGHKESQERLGLLVQEAPKGKKDTLVSAGEVWFTPDGVLALVVVCQALSWCMLEEQEVNGMITVVVELIISACHLTPSILYTTGVGFSDMHMCMEQSMNYQYRELISIMFPVLCVWLHHVRQC